jgi:glycosyltransferase involved in cell wall biosynthesis
MSLGCPAVVAPCGALPEVCAGAAVYAAPDQAEEWVEAFLRLSEDREHWQVQSDQGRARASDYSWSASASRLLTILNDLDQGL